ncbi:hypothetical protein [Bradyrhizobium elkanii]|uniref:hypothetical protein n=1 Tax=Bradyrhizobium elkanii TaxID=29448 RepID=UPI0004B5DBE7|nr:hypothetical protein [Bradyrhizobium elkanii]
MRVSIITSDNKVFVGGEAMDVDCSALATDGLHALQWYGEFGELEFAQEFDGERWQLKPNKMITDLSPYQSYVDQWQAAKKEHDDRVEAARLKAEEDWRIANRTPEEIERDARLMLEQIYGSN